MRDHEHETKEDGAHAQPPQKLKTGGVHERAHQHAEAHPDLLRDERLAHPANAEPLAELLSQLQHSHGNAYVQRVVGEAGEAKTQEPKPAAESREQSSAQGLDAGTRSLMESAFGESFGDVRVHTGKHAGDAAEELGARAFTRGRDIYFNVGEFDPSTREGKEVLAHELAHVAQQRRGGGAGGRGSDGREAVEREADEASRLVASGGAARVGFVADQTSTYLQSQQQGGGAHPPTQAAPGPQPQQQQPPAQTPSAHVVATPAMDAAFRQIFYSTTFEDIWASFFVLPDDRCPHNLRMVFAERFPRAMADLRAQRPANLPEEIFLTRYFEAVWAAVRADFRNRLRQHYRTSPTFRQRVRDLQRPIPPDAMIA
jgi:hypothetical protein